tara:strand:- start:1726 stop:1971 length:246 start_codon:yes stop_codon:yes gene_type:complete
MVFGLDIATAGLSSLLIVLVYVLLIWTMIWKGIALWKSGRNKQLTWFVVLFIVNTAGILPIIYLIWFQKKPKAVGKVKKKK